jgi:tRNA U55 pseudouridine synthase TruB
MIGEKCEVDLHRLDLKEVIGRFIGRLDQSPPVFSAKKTGG